MRHFPGSIDPSKSLFRRVLVDEYQGEIPEIEIILIKVKNFYMNYIIHEHNFSEILTVEKMREHLVSVLKWHKREIDNKYDEFAGALIKIKKTRHSVGSVGFIVNDSLDYIISEVGKNGNALFVMLSKTIKREYVEKCTKQLGFRPIR